MFNTLAGYVCGGRFSDPVPQAEPAPGQAREPLCCSTDRQQQRNGGQNLTTATAKDGFDTSDWVFLDFDTVEDGLSAASSCSVDDFPEALDIELCELALHSLPLSSLSGSSRDSSPVTGGWKIAPPTCFVDKQKSVAGGGILETSSFENLLIEHPSMSVYSHRSGAGGDRNTTMQHSLRGQSSDDCCSIYDTGFQHSEDGDTLRDGFNSFLEPESAQVPSSFDIGESTATSTRRRRSTPLTMKKPKPPPPEAAQIKGNRNSFRRANLVGNGAGGGRPKSRKNRMKDFSGKNNDRKCQ